jgi:lysine 2,3-aminomutase
MTSAHDLSTPNDNDAPLKSKAEPPKDRRVKPPVSPESLTHRELRDGEWWRELPAFSQVGEEDFLSHIWQMRNSAYGEEKLVGIMEGVAPDDFVEDVKKGFHLVPMAVRVTPYLLSLIDWKNPWEDPIRRQFIPLASQLLPNHPMLTLDSLHEQADAPVEGLTHRYQDKALFLVMDTCPVYCRFCTRSYAIGVDTDTVEKVNLRVDPKRWERAFEYIESRPELEDIVISGGDTYNLPAKHVKAIGERLLNMENIRRIRFATKGPAVMPMKVLSDEKWLDAMTDVLNHGRKLHKEVCIHTHFNTPNEVSAISKRAMGVLFERGMTVRNQCVLQRGVNDSAEAMTLLTKRLSEINVQPYYVYQHDMVQGVEDLRTTVQANIDIEKQVRGTTAGFNTATHVVDAPAGGGKRDVHSYDYYNRETGVSVYTAPSVKPGAYFLYFDPLRALADDVQQAWQDPVEQKIMCEQAIAEAKALQGHR